MIIRIAKPFYLKLNRQVLYIAKDKPIAAKKFKKDVLLEIKKIPTRAYSYKKSDFFDDNDIREMIFKGYRIIFEIKTTEIIVFGFHKWEDTLKD